MRRDTVSHSESLTKALGIITSNISLKNKLDHIIETTSKVINAGVSLIILDSTGDRLIHTSSCKLPKYYLQKGLIDRYKSLDEISSSRPVIINKIQADSPIEYPELARRARINAIAGIPVSIGDITIGSLRAYLRNNREFINEDIELLKQMATLAALAIGQNRQDSLCQNEQAQLHNRYPLKDIRNASFAHDSEYEFAKILDFYNIEWVYEPRSFILKQDGNRITEMFSPDFYLPALDLYVELTTLKQSLITHKNRKIRQLKELYPDINITLMNKNNYDTLLAKYGAGPLGQTRAHGIQRILYSKEQIEEKVEAIATRISNDYKDKRPVLLGVQRGFICFMADLIRHISIPLDIDFMAISHYLSGNNDKVKITKDIDLNIDGRHVLLIEDIIDTGMTLSLILNHLRRREPASLEVCTLLDRKTRRIANVDIRYSGFEVKDEFVVGYGLDYKEEYRNLPFIGVPNISAGPFE